MNRKIWIIIIIIELIIILSLLGILLYFILKKQNKEEYITLPFQIAAGHAKDETTTISFPIPFSMSPIVFSTVINSFSNRQATYNSIISNNSITATSFQPDSTQSWPMCGICWLATDLIINTITS